jgi:hypothetical protein
MGNPRRVPVVTVEYKGITFRRYPFARSRTFRVYYSPPGKSKAQGVDYLHREVWKDARGPIPVGCEIHHRDDDPDNNRLENLECLTVAEHRRVHATMGSFSTPRVRANLERIRPLASEWHRSEEGRAWHREHGRKVMAVRSRVEKACEHCGQPFTTIHKGMARFCSGRCRQRAAGRPAPSGPMRTCPQCGKEFQVKVASKPAECCSRTCGIRRRYGFPPTAEVS